MRRGRLAPSLALALALSGCAAPGSAIPPSVESLGVDLASLPICADSLPFTGDTIGTGYRGPQPTQITIPETAMRRMRGRGDVVVRYLVATNGRVDSVVASGVTDPDEIAAFRQDARGMRFRPARFRECRLRGWTTLKMTFP